ncbi:MAG: FxsA family protein [Gammaproteobacteria bacterium]|nr:FxsA family protein [Gammaproteobacteria bacterium]
MNPFFILLALFFIVPIIEIYLLIEIGSIVGPFLTIFLVVFTAVLGAWLLRMQGFSTLNRVRQTLARGGVPATEILEGAMLLIAGALLLTPGFFTDTIGFLCLLPSIRRPIALWGIQRIFRFPKSPNAGEGRRHGSQSNKSNIIEGEYRREDDH